MTPELFVVILVVLTALTFDFTNGFHDSANAVATAVATKAMTPRTAVVPAAVLNVVGAFLSTEGQDLLALSRAGDEESPRGSRATVLRGAGYLCLALAAAVVLFDIYLMVPAFH